MLYFTNQGSHLMLEKHDSERLSCLRPHSRPKAELQFAQGSRVLPTTQRKPFSESFHRGSWSLVSEGCVKGFLLQTALPTRWCLVL